MFNVQYRNNIKYQLAKKGREKKKKKFLKKR